MLLIAKPPSLSSLDDLVPSLVLFPSLSPFSPFSHSQNDDAPSIRFHSYTFILPNSLFWNIISLFFFFCSKRSHPSVSPFQLVRVLLCTTQIDFQPFYWVLPQKGETISFGPFHFCLYKSKKIAVLEIIFFFRFEMKFFVFCVLCVLTLCVHADSSIEAVQGLVSRVIGAVFFSVFVVPIPSS